MSIQIQTPFEYELSEIDRILCTVIHELIEKGQYSKPFSYNSLCPSSPICTIFLDI